jgi:hypothetical protein
VASIITSRCHHRNRDIDQLCLLLRSATTLDRSSISRSIANPPHFSVSIHFPPPFLPITALVMSSTHRPADAGRANMVSDRPQQSGGVSSGGTMHSHHSNNQHGPHTQTRYMCALYGLVRYESTGGGGVGSVPAPVMAVARLCSLLRAMCHSDGQRLIHGRQAAALLDLPAPIATTRPYGGAGTPATPATPHQPQSPFLASPAPSKNVQTSSASAGGANVAPTFASLPTFHQASYALIDATAVPSQLAQDVAYLTDRERRLQPIVSLVAAPTPWALLVPPRFSRYVRVYRAVGGGGPGAAGAVGGAEAKSDLHAWRELELPSFAPVPMFHGPSSSTAQPNAATAGAAHEAWRLSYLGKALLPTKTLCHVRPIRVTPVSTNYTAFLEQNSSVAYERDYEYIQEGFRFEDRDGIEILIYQVLKVS